VTDKRKTSKEMDKFYIDRQFGQAIWIDVDNGIVIRCYNESEKFIAVMNEKYVGKSITFLNEDFIGRAMMGTYHSLRPDVTTTLHLQINSFDTRIRHLWNEYSSLEVTKERQSEIKGQVKELEPQQGALERQLLAEKLRIAEEHKFIVS